MNTLQKFEAKWREAKFISVGLDTEYDKLPDSIRTIQGRGEAITQFNRQIIDSTIGLAGSYKLNSGFYEAEGQDGLKALKATINYIKEKDTEMPIILDAKRADIGNTNNRYVKMAFEELGADSVTVNPYLGEEALRPFLDQKEKLIIVLVKTSNPGSGEFQDLELKDGSKLYENVAKQVAKWNKAGNLGVVVGATYPEELSQVRTLVGSMPILIPGIGKQGGDVEATVKAGQDSHGRGMIINSSSAIIFAKDPVRFR